MISIFNRFILGFCMAMCASFFTGKSFAVSYEALDLVDGSGLVFQPDARLNFGQQGTVEFLIAATRNSTTPQCVMQLGDEDGSGFTITLHPQRKAIYIDAGAGAYAVNFDFSDGQYHHVAFVTQNSQTTAFVDGSIPMQPGDGDELIEAFPAGFGFGRAGARGLPFTIGCNNPTPFAGWIASVRFWDIPFQAGEMEQLRDIYGYPGNTFDARLKSFVDEYLIAYSHFTSESKSLYFTEPELVLHEDGAPLSGLDQWLIYDRAQVSNARPSRIYVHDRDGGIRDLRFGFHDAGEFPSILPHRKDWTARDQFDLNRLRSEFFQLNDNPGRREDVAKEASRLLIGFEEISQQGKTAAGRLGWKIIPMNANEYLTRVAGVHDSSEIFYLGLTTNQRALPFLGRKSVGGTVFSYALPPYSIFEGVNLSWSEEGHLRRFGLLSSPQPVPENDRPLLALADRLWVTDNHCAPQIDALKVTRAGHVHSQNRVPKLHGVYTTPTVGRFFYNEKTRRLTRALDHIRNNNTAFDDQGQCGQVQTGIRFVDRSIFAQSGGNPPNRLFDTSFPPNGLGLILVDNGDRIVPVGQQQIKDMVRPPKNSTTAKDKIAWGGTFALPHRPANLRSNFIGYDITRLNPHNYLKGRGLKNLVFEYPDEDSTDYQTTDSNLIIPHGMFFKSDVSAEENTNTIVVSSAAEYKHYWSVNLGFNIGFGLDGLGGAFSADAGYAKRSEVRRERKSITSITQTSEVHYALIADRSRVQLHDEFMKQVLALRDLRLLDLLSQEAVNRLIEMYGTHYPYAVTYGGMAFLETDYEEKSYQHMKGTNQTFSEQSSVSFGGQSGGSGCGCGDKSSSDSLSIGSKSSFEDDRETSGALQRSYDSHVFGTYGGSITRGEGWSLAHGQEVPLYFDMRPLSELLSPVFFDDPIVWDVIEPMLDRAIGAHLANAADEQHHTKPDWFLAEHAALMRSQPKVFAHAYKAGR